MPNWMNRCGVVFALLVLSLCLCAMPALAQDVDVQVVTTEGNAMRVVVSPTGDLAAAYADSPLLSDRIDRAWLPVRLFDLTTGAQIEVLRGMGDYTRSALFTPDGLQLITQHGNGDLNVWDVESGELLRTIYLGMPGSMRRMAFLPDGVTLAMTSVEIIPTIELWNIETGARTGLLSQRFASYDEFREIVLERRPSNDQLIALDVSPDGTRITGATLREDIWQWNLTTGEGAILFDGEADQPTLGVRVVKYLDNERIAFLHDTDDIMTFIDAETGDVLERFPLQARAFAVSPDGATLAWAVPNDTAVYVAPLDAPEDVTAINLDWEVPNQAEIAFTPDGQRLVVGGMTPPNADSTGAFAVVALP